MKRRESLQLLALLATGSQTGSSQQAAPTLAQRIDKPTLMAALKVLGLEFPDAQLDLMLRNVNRSLTSIDTLRQIPVPYDTAPAFQFNPRLPGSTLPKAGRFRPAKTKAPRDWTRPEDLAFRPLTELAALLRAKRVTSTALTKMYLERLKQLSPKLLCTVTVTEDLALEQARTADAEIRKGKYRGPLHGVPWGAKDLFATKGIPTTWGAEPFEKQVFDYNAAVVDKLDKAGAVLVGKMSMGALAMGGLWFAGMTKTPWNLELTSSGSSAGSASATAAGLLGFAIGTETLGSIISPSIRCGVVGLRPTFGRVSRHGAMALSWTMDKIGPICRSVEDCALVLKAIHGADARDATSVEAPFNWEPAQPLARLRVGFLQKDFDSLKDAEKKLYDEALADLAKAGVQLNPVELPEFETAPLMMILSAEGATAFDDLTREGGVNQLKDQGPGAWPNSFRSSRLIPAVEYLRASRARTLLMQSFDRFMKDWDVLVSPPYAGSILTATNFTGHPQITVPCGFVDGLPRGLVFTGRLYEEGLPMRVALAYEKATKWHTMQPQIA